MRTKHQIDEILDAVRTRLNVKRQATGIDLRVANDAYLEDDEWLNVIVSPAPNGQPIRAHQYVNTLGEVEKELRGDGIEKVLLVPAGAD